MHIGGFQKFSLIDYPGKICAIIFTQGCNFRCPYCYNIDLVLPDHFKTSVPEKEVFSFLKQRKGKLDAVEITGGEPTLQPDLIDVIRQIKEIGFLVKLDSNGSHPEILQRIAALNIVDYFAMDIKAPLKRYQEVTRARIDSSKIAKSVKIIMQSGSDYEFRTTVAKPLFERKDFLEIGKVIEGAKFYALQNFEKKKILLSDMPLEEYSSKELQEFCEIVNPYVKKCVIR